VGVPKTGLVVPDTGKMGRHWDLADAGHAGNRQSVPTVMYRDSQTISLHMGE
jgi:hypothetical protein